MIFDGVIVKNISTHMDNSGSGTIGERRYMYYGKENRDIKDDSSH